MVGVTSSAIKGERLLTELNYDAFINHRSETIHEDIESACPQGIDVYFDNVGGPLLEVILDHINDRARIPFCGAVADYTRLAPQGPSNLFQLVTHSAKLEGFMTHLQADRYPEARQQLLKWIAQGQLKSVVAEYEGVEQCGDAFSNLFAGVNFGKSVVRVR